MERRATGRYRIDFALIVLGGNLTRYLNVRPVVEGDATVQSRWYPIRTWEQHDWLRFLPGGLRLRARHFLDSWELFVRRPADAVVIHALETYSLYGLFHRLFRLKTVLICNPDAGFDANGRFSRWALGQAVHETSLFVPFSTYTARSMRKEYPDIADRICVMHPGLPIERWPVRPPPGADEGFRVLFVAADAEVKGIDVVLSAFEQSLHRTCDLVVATQRVFLAPDLEARMGSAPWLSLHLDLTPGCHELQELFRTSHAFVLPSRSDLSPWVAVEAMATGLPVVITDVGGIADIVRHGETGLIVTPDDVDGVIDAVDRLRSCPDLARRLSEAGRRHVVTHFDVEKNTARLLAMAKVLIDQRRATSSSRPGGEDPVSPPAAVAER